MPAATIADESTILRLERSAVSLLGIARGLMYFSPRNSRRYAPLLLLV
ncbi:hypothetical protein [Gardnerella vaginalis]